MVRSTKHYPKSRRAKRGFSRRKMIISSLGVGAAYGGLLLGSSLMPVVGSQTSPEVGTHYTVFFDHSEDYSAGQNAMIESVLLKGLPDKIRSGDQLDLFALHPDASGAVVRLFSAISPKRASEVNRVLESPRRQQTRWQSQFWDAFCLQLVEIREMPELDQSPLIEGWFEVSRYVRNSNAKQKVVIIVSDGLQYSQKHGSAYSGSIYRQSANLRARFPADFDGADVHLLYLFRTSQANAQNDQHREWLEDWFTQSNAGQVRIERR